MPRTKIGKFLTPPYQLRARLIRAAGCRAGYCKDKELAEVSGLDAKRISDRYTGKVLWTVDDLSAIAIATKMSDEEIAKIVRGREA